MVGPRWGPCAVPSVTGWTLHTSVEQVPNLPTTSRCSCRPAGGSQQVSAMHRAACCGALLRAIQLHYLLGENFCKGRPESPLCCCLGRPSGGRCSRPGPQRDGLALGLHCRTGPDACRDAALCARRQLSAAGKVCHRVGVQARRFVCSWAPPKDGLPFNLLQRYWMSFHFPVHARQVLPVAAVLCISSSARVTPLNAGSTWMASF